jgi:hypothetical protein
VTAFESDYRAFVARDTAGRYLGYDNKGALATGYPVWGNRKNAHEFTTFEDATDAVRSPLSDATAIRNGGAPVGDVELCQVVRVDRFICKMVLT